MEEQMEVECPTEDCGAPYEGFYHEVEDEVNSPVDYDANIAAQIEVAKKVLRAYVMSADFRDQLKQAFFSKTKHLFKDDKVPFECRPSHLFKKWFNPIFNHMANNNMPSESLPTYEGVDESFWELWKRKENEQVSDHTKRVSKLVNDFAKEADEHWQSDEFVRNFRASYWNVNKEEIKETIRDQVKSWIDDSLKDEIDKGIESSGNPFSIEKLSISIPVKYTFDNPKMRLDFTLSFSCKFNLLEEPSPSSAMSTIINDILIS